MSKYRLAVLAFGPIVIVTCCMSLCDWLHSEFSGPPSANHVLVSRAMADEPPASAADAKLEAACRQVAEKLRPRLGAECHTIVRAPLVIAGDLSEAALDDWYHETIGPAAVAMARRYFKHPPSQPITVLLWSGESSYNHYAEKLYGDRNVSIYGYYKPNDRVLVMNIATGGGTLVHELTHALVDFDFPAIPDWFNEGLASLHEQCRFRDDADGAWIEGLENWRLPGLQKAISRSRLRTLQSLIESQTFRGKQEGLNYAHARYFCLYMQRRGVLEKFYRTFRDNQTDDPQGSATALAMFPQFSWEELDADFRRWATSLQR